MLKKNPAEFFLEIYKKKIKSEYNSGLMIFVITFVIGNFKSELNFKTFLG